MGVSDSGRFFCRELQRKYGISPSPSGLTDPSPGGSINSVATHMLPGGVPGRFAGVTPSPEQFQMAPPRYATGSFLGGGSAFATNPNLARMPSLPSGRVDNAVAGGAGGGVTRPSGFPGFGPEKLGAGGGSREGAGAQAGAVPTAGEGADGVGGQYSYKAPGRPALFPDEDSTTELYRQLIRCRWGQTWRVQKKADIYLDKRCWSS